jgi:predicted phosphodiesterase
MKLVATSDTHFPVVDGLIPDADIFVHCGDLMQSGYESEWKPCLEWIAKLPHKLKYMVHGNHDFHPFNYPGPALQDLRSIGVTVLGYPGNSRYYKQELPNGMIIGGCPHVTGLDRWAFNATEKQIEDFLEHLGEVDILVTHSPPYGYLDKIAYFNEHIGVKAFNEYLNKWKPKYMFCGHVHEGYGAIVHPSGTTIFNVAMCDRQYKHVNPPMVIEL